MDRELRVAILYQAQEPPIINGIKKPMKNGGYSDSGADIAFSLQQASISVITPIPSPNIFQDKDWVFPDTEKGIEDAILKGATILWLNTVLYKNHPIEKYLHKIKVVGQNPENVEIYDDKWKTNYLLKENNLPIPQSFLISKNNLNLESLKLNFPIIIKPIRGRGSQGVTKVDNFNTLKTIINSTIQKNIFGNTLYLEDYLSGEELTLTIMPPGIYYFNNEQKIIQNYWCLPPVKRFNHQNGIAPYNGTVAIIHNSKVLSEEEYKKNNIKKLIQQCEKAAELVGAKAPIRIDCRADKEGNYFLFDLNMKPNMTGASRPQRKDQDSLSALAARAIGWSYTDLLINMLHQYW